MKYHATDRIKLRRAIAYLIDWYLSYMLCYAILLGSSVINKNMVSPDLNLLNFSGNDVVLFMLFFSIIYILYYSLIPVFLWKGQTLGKRLMKIQTVILNKDKAAVLVYLKRTFLGMVIVEGALTVLSTYNIQAIIIFTGWESVQTIFYIYSLITLISIGMAVFSPRQRMLHDIIGGTIVIRKEGEV